jgi:hypothetical protein
MHAQSSDTASATTIVLDRAPRTLLDRPAAVFIVSLVVRGILAAIFLGGADSMNALTAIPLAAMRKYFFLPYFPVVQNILGATSPLMNHAHFVPMGLTVKLVPCIVDSLISVWLLENNRFDRQYRRCSAWLYAFCPLPLILVCLQGQWDSLWVLPAVTALALADLLANATKARRTTLLLIGALLGLAVLSKPVAFIVAGLVLPSLRYRESVLRWIYDVTLITIGAAITVVLFFLKFAANGVHIHQNIFRALEYGGQPVSTFFGLADLSIFKHFNSLQTSAAMDFRQLAIIYVIAIVLYQLVARDPIDRMSAAAAAVLVCPAIGGLASQYFFWPIVFILAAGRLRVANAYAIIASSTYLLYFLIPGASNNPGENLGALLPLKSLRFLGIPLAAQKWFATPTMLEVWHSLANLFIPLAMCALGIYLLLSRRTDRVAPHLKSAEPLAFPSLRAVVPYTVLLVLAVLVYGMVSSHDSEATISLIYRGVNHYAFAHPIYTWRHWRIWLYWTAKHPYRELLSGSWWGTILFLGPIGIAAWGAIAVRASRLTAPRREVSAAPR